MSVAAGAGARASGAGFVGATSYNDIFEEGLDGDVDGGGAEDGAAMKEGAEGRDEDAATGLDGGGGGEGEEAAAATEEQVSRGVAVLGFLRDRELVERFVWKWYEVNEGTGGMTLEYLMREWLAQLWAAHGDVLSAQDPAGLRRLSALLWRNSRSPLAVDSDTTGTQFARLGSGENLRWEVVGCIAATMGLAASCLPTTDEFLARRQGEGGDGARTTRQEICREKYAIAEACLAFCRECEIVDDMFTWLLMDATGLLQSFMGIRHYAMYVALGECISACFAMGFHQAGADKHTPFFLSEIRKRALIGTYCMEVSIATFLGRPPRMSHRHCVLDQPLDLEDGEIFLTGAELARVLSTLDAQGFGTTGRIGRMTRARIWFGYAPRREDIVDLALSVGLSKSEVLARADAIRAGMDAHMASLPPSLVAAYQRDMEELGGPTALASATRTRPLEALEQAQLRQGARANELLLQRVLMRRAGAGPERLLKVARETLSDVLAVTGRHDVAAKFQVDVTMLLIGHGLRSAAIIAVELLKQEQRMQRYWADERRRSLQDGGGQDQAQTQPPPTMLLPRSSTIQELSVFAARLGNVDPTDGSYSACEQGRKVLTRILDKILTPGDGQATTAQPAQGQQQQQKQQPAPGPTGTARHMGETNGEAPGTGFDPRPHAVQMPQANSALDFGGPLSFTQADVTGAMFGNGELLDVNIPTGPHAAGSIDLGVGGGDFDFTQWLGTMDWELSGALGGF